MSLYRTCRQTSLTLLLGSSILLLDPTAVQARNGFIPHYVGIEGIISGAGTALPLDASSTIANPAALTRLDTHLMGTLGVMGQNQHVDTSKTPVGQFGPMGNTIGGQKNGYKAVPVGTLGVNYKFNPCWALGFTVTGGGGFVKFKYPVTNPAFQNPPGNFNKKTVNQVTLSATTLSYRPSSWQSYGISLLVASSNFKSDLSLDGQNEVSGRLKSNMVFGAGTRIGGIWDIGKYFTFGASVATPVYATRHNKYKELFVHKFQIPATLRLGGVIHFSECTDLVFDYKNLFYGKSKWLQGATGQEWKTQTIYLIGITHKINQQIMLGLGYNYAKVPIKSKVVYKNMLSIPLDEHHISCGFKYNFDNKKLELYGIGYYIPEKKMTDDGKQLPFAKGIKLQNWGRGCEFGFVYKF